MYQLNKFTIFNLQLDMPFGDKKYHNYSLSFYHKEEALRSVSSRAAIQYSNFGKHDKTLKPRSIEVFTQFVSKNKENQQEMIQDDRQSVIQALFDVMKNLNSDRDLMQFVLPTIDAILSEQSKTVRTVVNNIVGQTFTNIISTLKNFLSLSDHRPATHEAAAHIISIILGELPKDKYDKDQKNFILDLLTRNKSEKNTVTLNEFSMLTCFAHLIKHTHLASFFLENNGGSFLLDCLRSPGNDIQEIYYSLLNLWLVSFSEEGIEKFIAVPGTKVIKSVCEILQRVSREKITRMAFLFFKNIESSSKCLQLMIDNKLLKIIDTLLRGNIKDNQLLQDIKEMGLVLEGNIKILSSFDKYVKEVNSQLLEWSSVHTERFFKENYMKFENNDFLMIKKLNELLIQKYHANIDEAIINQNIAIACYDLGQFARFYPKGKAILESLNVKDTIMDKAKYSESKIVREQALLSLQKIMIQNWQSI